MVSITHVVACQVYHTCSGVSCYLCPQTPNLILWMMGVGSDTLSGTGSDTLSGTGSDTLSGTASVGVDVLSKD